MRQSTIIFGTLLFSFVVYITMRGQLPAYLDLFKSKQRASSVSSSSTASSASSSSNSGSLLDQLAKPALDGLKNKAKDLFGSAKSDLFK